MLEDECGKCYSAKGNCVCRLHGSFAGGRKMAAVRKKGRKKPKK